VYNNETSNTGSLARLERRAQAVRAVDAAFVVVVDAAPADFDAGGRRHPSISMSTSSLCQLTHDVRESRCADRTPIGIPLCVPRLSMMFVNLVAPTGRSTISLPS
jgi:hypothetical protein